MVFISSCSICGGVPIGFIYHAMVLCSSCREVEVDLCPTALEHLADRLDKLDMPMSAHRCRKLAEWQELTRGLDIPTKRRKRK